MNTQIGKSFGIALLLAVGVIAVMLAWNPFTASAKVADSATATATSITESEATTLTIAFSIAGASDGKTIEIVLPAFTSTNSDHKIAVADVKPTLDGAAAGISAGVSGNTVTLTLVDSPTADAQKIEAVISKLVNPAAIPDTFQVTVKQGSTDQQAADITLSATAGESKELTLSSYTAGAKVQVVIDATADTKKGSATDITIGLAGFTVPAVITERSIIIEDVNGKGDEAGTKDNGYVGEPSAVVVSGTKVTLSLYSRFPNGDVGTLFGDYRITFKQSAGIINPAKAGTATVTVGDGDPTGHTLKRTIKSAVTLSSGSAPRGTMVTVSGVGLGKGGATVYLVVGCADQHMDCGTDEDREEDDISLGTGDVSDGKVSVEIETSSSDFIAGVDQIDKGGNAAAGPPYASTDYLRGRNQITIVDGTGRTADITAYFTITPTIAVDEDAVQQGDELTIIVEDWYYGIGLPTVTIGDETASVESRGSGSDFEIEIIVPTTARLGEQELKVTGTTSDNQGSLTAAKPDVAKGSVVIGALDIDVEPSSFVLGQQFTISVKGFSTDDPLPLPQGDITSLANGSRLAEIQSIKVGNIPLKETTGGVDVARLTIDTNGFFTNTFRLSSSDTLQYLKPGSYRVQVKDHSGRVALGRITIPEPTITVTPSVSRRGTSVAVAGENFPANRVVEIFYRDTEDENQQGAALADSAGGINVSFTVPSNAEIGEEQDVTARSAANVNQYKAKAKHALPPQEIIVSPMEVAPGGHLTIEGHNMPLFTLVYLDIADIRVEGKGVETDGLGSFVREDVLVPQLKPGTHTVEASVETQGADPAKVRTTIEIVEAFAPAPAADVFEELGERLVRVWQLDAATQTWSFYDPREEFADFNSLIEVSSGEIVSIIINTGAKVEFTRSSASLYPGTNPVALN